MGLSKLTKFQKGRLPPPTASVRSLPVNHNRRHPSITSVISDYSGRSTPPISLARVDEEKPNASRRIIFPKDDFFGLSQMMSIIELRSPKGESELLFGMPIDLESLHPDIREIYAPAFKQLEDIDKVCLFCYDLITPYNKLSSGPRWIFSPLACWCILECKSYLSILTIYIAPDFVAAHLILYIFLAETLGTLNH
jgi:hypothetical protein